MGSLYPKPNYQEERLKNLKKQFDLLEQKLERRAAPKDFLMLVARVEQLEKIVLDLKLDADWSQQLRDMETR